MTVAISTEPAGSGFLRVRILGNAVAAGLVGQIANPEGQLLQITEAWIHVITASVAASTFNVGIGATGVDSNDLLSAFPVNPAANTVWTVVTRAAAEAAATGTQSGGLWAANTFLTVTSAAAASTGLVADLYVKYIRLLTA
jgi:hypothetical protein